MRPMLHGLAVVLGWPDRPRCRRRPRSTGAAEAKLAKLLEGRTAGAPVDCINQRLIASSQIIDKTAIVYRMPGGALYVNRPTAAPTRWTATPSWSARPSAISSAAWTS
jgi:hypothetical protein